MSKEVYTLKIFIGQKSKKIRIEANDNYHAHAQAADISRALKVESFALAYGHTKRTRLSELFRRLAYSDFSHGDCCLWEGSQTNNNPVIYVLGKRFYVRRITLDYLDITTADCVKGKCQKQMCVNPYHFVYFKEKSSKLSVGDKQLLLAFASQGASATQCAKALNVHRSTVYRNLKT